MKCEPTGHEPEAEVMSLCFWFLMEELVNITVSLPNILHFKADEMEACTMTSLLRFRVNIYHLYQRFVKSKCTRNLCWWWNEPQRTQTQHSCKCWRSVQINVHPHPCSGSLWLLTYTHTHFSDPLKHCRSPPETGTSTLTHSHTHWFTEPNSDMAQTIHWLTDHESGLISNCR